MIECSFGLYKVSLPSFDPLRDVPDIDQDLFSGLRIAKDGFLSVCGTVDRACFRQIDAIKGLEKGYFHAEMRVILENKVVSVV